MQWGWRRLLRLLAAAVLLLLVFRAIDVHAAWALIVGSKPGWLLLGVLLVQVQVVGSAVRWWLTGQALEQRFGVAHAIREYYLATLVNQTVPGGVTGDAARAVRTRGSVSSVVLERLAGQLALAAVTMIGLLVFPGILNDAPLAVRSALLLAAVLLLGVAVLSTLPRSTRLAPMLRRAWFDDGAWWRQSLLSLAVVGSYLGVFAVAAMSLGEPLPLNALLGIVPLTLLTMLLPVSIGGWGVREAAASALWPLAGLSAETGVATSILYGLVSLVGALPALWWLSRRA